MTDVISCFLKDEEGNILILKRSDKVLTYKGYWSGIAGYVEKDEKPIDTAYKEIREEVGLKDSDISLIKQGDIYSYTDIYEGKKYDWVIHPFLFDTSSKSKINIDWEHTEYRWILPQDIKKFDTVPHLEDIVRFLFGWGSCGGGEER